MDALDITCRSLTDRTATAAARPGRERYRPAWPLCGRSLYGLVGLGLVMLVAGCRSHDPDASHRATVPRNADLRTRYLTDYIPFDTPWDSRPDFSNLPPELIAEVPDDALLTSELMVQEVLRIHPSLDAAEAAWRAATELHPQVTALHDPQFRFLNGPTLFGSSAGQHLWRLQFQQRVPWMFKRRLAGEIADYRAKMAKFDQYLAQRKLTIVAKDAFLNYARQEELYDLAMRKLTLAEEELAAEMEKQLALDPGSETSFEAMELKRLQIAEQRDAIHQSRWRAIARVNQLLNRPLDAPLPRPLVPDSTPFLPEKGALIDLCMARHPEFKIAVLREREAKANLDLAHADYYTDLEAVGRFDTYADAFWAPDRANIRPQLGVNLYLPIQQGRRAARVRQTEWELRRRRAETRELQNDIAETINSAVAEVERTQRRLALVERQVALAERQVELAQRNETPLDEARKLHKQLLDYRIALTRVQHELLTQMSGIQVLTAADELRPDVFEAEPAPTIDERVLPIEELPLPEGQVGDSIFDW